jgi:hypothetical protein
MRCTHTRAMCTHTCTRCLVQEITNINMKTALQAACTVQTYVYIYIYMYVCMYTHTHKYMHTCQSSYLLILESQHCMLCTNACVCVCIYIYIYIYIYISTYIRVEFHTCWYLRANFPKAICAITSMASASSSRLAASPYSVHARWYSRGTPLCIQMCIRV